MREPFENTGDIICKETLSGGGLVEMVPRRRLYSFKDTVRGETC